MKNLLVLAAAILVLINIATAQDFDWAVMAGGEGSDQAYAIATDHFGNSYVTGWFSESAHFDDIILTSEGGKDIFLAKYNENGEILWAKRAWGEASNTPAGITIGGEGFPVITGWFAETIHFDETVLESNGSYDMFVARYNSEGDVIWAKGAGGEGDDYGNRLTSNHQGDIIVAGSFRYTMLLGEISITSEGNRDIFISSYASNGDFQWAKKAGGEGEDRAYGIISNNEGTIYFTGVFNGKAFFGDHELMSNSFLSTFIAKMDASGNFLWVEKGNGGANDYARGFGIGMDGEGNIYGNGTFSGKLLFGDGVVEATGGEYDFDTYIVKYNTNGEQIWLKKAGGYGMDQGQEMFTDADGNSFVTGFFSTEAEFDDFEIESEGKSDIFVAQYNWAGEVQWVKRAGGNYLDYAYGISQGNPETHSLYICGNFQEEAAFDENEVSGWGMEDMFVAKLNYEGSFINESEIKSLPIYPNPSNGHFEINVGEHTVNITIKIYSVEGKLLSEQQLPKVQGNIKIKTDLPSGVYNLMIPQLNSNSKLIIK